MGNLTRASGSLGNYRGQFTWANRPTTGFLGQYIIISDLGVGTTEAYWNGTKWVTGAFTQIQSGRRLIIPSLAAANANGYVQAGNTVTVTAAAHGILAAENGASIYLVQGTISTGVAPQLANQWGTNFQWLTANTFSFQALNSQSATGFFNTNVNETVFTPLTTAIPGHTIGANGIVENIISMTFDGSAISRFLNCYLAGYKYTGLSWSGYKQDRSYSQLQNANSELVQTSIDTNSIPDGFNYTITAQFTNGAIDTTVAQNLTFSGRVTAANGYIALMAIKTVVSPA